jgi:hypothetical protein
MSDIVYVSDFFLDETVGGAELVDNTIMWHLSKEFKVSKVKSRNLILDRSKFYVLSNLSQIDAKTLDLLVNGGYKYIIIEHDYKIHHTRHPWRFKDSIIPRNERINYNLYKNAKRVFTQTDDHTDIFLRNDVYASFFSFGVSVWSEDELGILTSLQSPSPMYREYAIIDSPNVIKNTKGAIDFCTTQKLDYRLIRQQKYKDFLHELSKYPTLVFFPMARETCCRLLVEARCLGLNVLTSENSGFFQSSYFNLKGQELINKLAHLSATNLQAVSYEINKSI